MSDRYPTPEELRRLAGPKPPPPPEPSRRQQRKEDRRIYNEYLARQEAARQAEVQRAWGEAREIVDSSSDQLKSAAARHEHATWVDVYDEAEAGRVAAVFREKGYRARVDETEDRVMEGEDQVSRYSYQVRVDW